MEACKQPLAIQIAKHSAINDRRVQDTQLPTELRRVLDLDHRVERRKEAQECSAVIGALPTMDSPGTSTRTRIQAGGERKKGRTRR